MNRDHIGEAYEASILQVLSDAKKRGEFFTPFELSTLISKMVGSVESVHDPACGSGSLLLTVDAKIKHGQELNDLTAEMARKNLPDATIITGDTLLMDAPGTFDAVVSNPPYSTTWEGYDPFDERWQGKPFAPKTKADMAFVLHGVQCMRKIGVFVMFPGTLYRTGKEAEIRQYLITHNLVDTVISLPEKLFLRTSIGVCLLVLRKDRNPKDPVLWIDASNEFKASGKQNVLQPDKILDAYLHRKEIDRFSTLVHPVDDVLTVRAYVDTTPPKKEIDIHVLNAVSKLLNRSTAKGLDLWDDLVDALEHGNKDMKTVSDEITHWKNERKNLREAYAYVVRDEEDNAEKKTLSVKDGFLCNQQFTVLTPKKKP